MLFRSNRQEPFCGSSSCRSISDSQVAEATLHLKGTTLRARERSEDMGHSVNLVAEDLARQVKRHRDKRRGRRAAAKAQPGAAPS